MEDTDDVVMAFKLYPESNGISLRGDRVSLKMQILAQAKTVE